MKSFSNDWWRLKYKKRFYSTHNRQTLLTLTINDLGFFGALQSSYHTNCPRDEAEIIQYVSRVYDEYDCIRINDIWLPLMAVLNLIIENHGGNNYTLLHMGKRALQQLAEHPVSLPVTPIALENSL
jgi:hypothetical protein